MRLLAVSLVFGALLLPAQQAKRQYDLYAHFDTSMGEIVAELYRDTSPRTVDNFVALVEGKKATYNRSADKVARPFYNGLTFHRVIKGFMIQTGEVKPGLPCGIPDLRDEIDTSRTFAEAGALAMANTGKPNTASCQIFITVSPQKPLDGKYTVFGHVISGQDVANQIAEVPVKGDRPVTPVIIRKVTIERRPK
ncbi:MAG TPA: peptidylprolyl isomerase [Bryobacteraceae bacterium]|nr:peptidylprolyl isomerase [Bryobacteraceae bacterium]